MRTCRHCGGEIPAGKRSNAVFCSDRCRKRYHEREVKRRARCVDCGVELGVDSARRGWVRCHRHDNARRAAIRQERVETVARLYNEGASFSDIARALGWGESSKPGSLLALAREQGLIIHYRYENYEGGRRVLR